MTALPKNVAALVAAASDPDFAAWRRSIVRLGGCTNPIHLVGGATVFDTTTGRPCTPTPRRCTAAAC